MNDHKLQPCEKRTIYQGIRKLMVGAEGVVGGMSKMHKYTLGSRLCQRLEMLQETTLKAYQAVGNPERQLKFIGIVKFRLDNLLFTYRVAQDLHQIRQDAYIDQVDTIVYLIDRTTAWEKTVAEKCVPGQSTAKSRGVPLSRTVPPNRG